MNQIPVTVLTGYLGAGKTTLRWWLPTPGMTWSPPDTRTVPPSSCRSTAITRFWSNNPARAL